MKKIKGYWGSRRSDIKLRDTDERFQDLVSQLESLDAIKLKVRARDDSGYGIPMQEAGYDIRMKLYEKVGYLSTREIADFELRLNARNQSENYVAFRGELPDVARDLVSKLGYQSRPSKHSFVSDRLF